MDNATLAIVAREFVRRRPEDAKLLRAITAARGTPFEAVAEQIVMATLQIFDEREQLQWQLRDLLIKRDKYNEQGQPDFYWSLKYNATDMVRRIHAAGNLNEVSGLQWVDGDQPHE